jgi:tripartite-type tricarboxylate transporter receptor subunit TctC
LADTPQCIVARKNFPAKDLKEFIEWLKQNPGKATAGTVGVGGPEVTGIYFQKTTKEMIVKLDAAVQAALADATVRKRFADQGQDIPPSEQQTPQALAAQQKAEIEKWWPIIKAANMKGE